MRACRSSSRLEGIGSSSPGASVPPRRWSAVASSSAKKGLPREVSQSLISVGRANRRVEAGCVAARGSRRGSGRRPSTVRSRSSGTARRSHSGTSPRTASRRGDRLHDPSGRARSRAPQATPRPATGRRRPPGRAGLSRANRPQPYNQGRGHGAVIRRRSAIAEQLANSSARRWIVGSSARRRRRHCRGGRSALRTRTPSRLLRVERRGSGIRGQPRRRCQPTTESSSRSLPRPAERRRRKAARALEELEDRSELLLPSTSCRAMTDTPLICADGSAHKVHAAGATPSELRRCCYGVALRPV